MDQLSADGYKDLISWDDCRFTLGNTDGDDTFDSDAAVYISSFFACQFESGTCLDGALGGSDTIPVASCGEVVECVLSCESLGDAACLDPYYFDAEDRAPVSDIFTCGLAYCGTDEESLSPSCLMEAFMSDAEDGCAAEAAVCGYTGGTIEGGEGEEAATEEEGGEAATEEGGEAATEEGGEAATRKAEKLRLRKAEKLRLRSRREAATEEEGGEAATEEGGEAATEEGGEAATEEGGEAATEEGGEAPTEEGGEAPTEEGGEAPTEEGGEAVTEEGGDETEATTYTVVTQGLAFSPDTLTIAVGDSVTFDLGGSHNAVEVSAETYGSNGSAALEGGFAVGFGGTETITFDTAGTFYYVCTPHAGAGIEERSSSSKTHDRSVLNTARSPYSAFFASARGRPFL